MKKLPQYEPECSESEALEAFRSHLQAQGGDLLSAPWFDRAEGEWIAAVIVDRRLVRAAFKLKPRPQQASDPSA